MKNFILKEAELHPFAQPQDYIKLIFQSEFGPGHLIADSDYAYNRLVTEWESVKNLPPEQDQPIGGGYIRVCIKGMDRQALENLNSRFVASANEKSGENDMFIAKLTMFLSLAAEGRLPVDYNRAKQAVDAYLADGIRPTSHTPVYHSHYTPAYRVVRA